jgi:hypothetical protein
MTVRCCELKCEEKAIRYIELIDLDDVDIKMGNKYFCNEHAPENSKIIILREVK